MTASAERLRCIEDLAGYFDRYAPDTLSEIINEALEFLVLPNWMQGEQESKVLLGVMIGYAMRIADMGGDGFEVAIADSCLDLGHYPESEGNDWSSENMRPF